MPASGAMEKRTSEAIAGTRNICRSPADRLRRRTGPDSARWDSVKHWWALVALGTAQFLMVLDTSVMNVSISQLVEDFDTEVTAIQAVITLYALVMAAFMIVGGRLGDILGRRRMFLVGLVVYGVGSALTAVAPTLWVLTLGWSVIEGLGAAMVLPAMAALVAESYPGRDRAVAYAVIGGLAGAGIAVGPMLGGWMTTYLTWRLVFAGEVVIVLAVLLCRRVIPTPAQAGPRPRLDGVGAALSAVGLALGVLGVLQSSTWGWVQPRNPLSPSSASPRHCSSSAPAWPSWPSSGTGSGGGKTGAPTPSCTCPC